MDYLATCVITCHATSYSIMKLFWDIFIFIKKKHVKANVCKMNTRH